MATITLYTPAGSYTNITVVVSSSLMRFLAHKGYTVIASKPVL